MRAGTAAAVIVMLMTTACSPGNEPQEENPGSAAADGSAPAVDVNATPEDSIIFADRMALAAAERLDTLPIGEIVARIGQTFVGDPYIPGTLEADGPEKLVVNLRVFDCVTFVENSLAIARTIKANGDYRHYIGELARIRYRDGRLSGYPARLHYFSDWIANNDAKGIARNLTQELGGVPDPEPITFMSEHVDSYRQLSEPGMTDSILATEARLTTEGHYMVPEDAIAGIADQVRNGDIIAATTNVAGLDVSHTGIALWVDGELRLMHAPLVGSVVQISPNSLAERILASTSQDGIMVARPQ